MTTPQSVPVGRGSTNMGRVCEFLNMVLSFAADADLSAAVAITSYSFGGLQMPTAIEGTEIKFHVSADDGTTYRQLYDLNNVAIARTIQASRSYPLPAEIFSFTHFKIETTTDQTANRTFVVCLKG